MKIEAAVMYKALRAQDAQGGLYVWVDPDDRTLLTLQRLMKNAPFKTKDCTEWHCTVLFFDGELPEDVDVPPDQMFPGQLVDLEVWTDHKDRQILVGIVESKSLQNVHRALTSQGLSHSFPDYKTHVTLAVGIDVGALDWVEERKKVLPLPVAFGPQLKGVSLS